MRTLPTTCFTILALLAIAGPTFAADQPEESLADVQKAIAAEKGVLIDVREKAEWDRGHIAGARLFPLSQLQEDIEQAAGKAIPTLPKDKIIYTHCAFGSRAATAAKLLEKQGYKVRALKPGYEELVKGGFSKAKE
ncbi:rhodanese-like domain-containing protein [Blastopirellula marina]|uniref:Rhodanese domain-containing protein n=1 Tax=Blastopirellula marina DSM 3645 TaxID=314230 RepID=A3ZUH7_9BACT|nr:rhodanese-like domain-containing protein [Blastopirellula marina]EAQ79887.1 hypothetical protein DSM3645_22144 [Blastopirellula marina DSM 3645]